MSQPISMPAASLTGFPAIYLSYFSSSYFIHVPFPENFSHCWAYFQPIFQPLRYFPSNISPKVFQPFSQFLLCHSEKKRHNEQKSCVNHWIHIAQTQKIGLDSEIFSHTPNHNTLTQDRGWYWMFLKWVYQFWAQWFGHCQI